MRETSSITWRCVCMTSGHCRNNWPGWDSHHWGVLSPMCWPTSTKFWEYCIASRARSGWTSPQRNRREASVAVACFRITASICWEAALPGGRCASSSQCLPTPPRTTTLPGSWLRREWTLHVSTARTMMPRPGRPLHRMCAVPPSRCNARCAFSWTWVGQK